MAICDTTDIGVLQKKTVKQLKEILKSKGLKVGGNKHDLIARLLALDQTQAEGSHGRSTPEQAPVNRPGT